MSYSGINLTKDVKETSVLKTINHYSERTMKILINADKIHGHGFGSLNIVRMAISPKSMYSVNASPIKITAGFCVEIDQLIPKFVEKYKGSRITKTILKNEELSGFKT